MTRPRRESLPVDSPASVAASGPPIDSRPEISVIIPVRNRRALLARALDSLVRQDETDFEVVVVDDGSTEPIQDVVDASGLTNIHLLRSSGRGAGVARNAGVAAARGKWIIFLDSDDEADQQWLSSMLRLARDSEAALVFCGARRMSDGKFRNGILPKRGDGREASTLFLAGTFMLEHETFTEVGGYDVSLPSSQHTDLGLRLLAHVDRHGRSIASTRAMLLTIHVQNEGNIRSDPEAVARGATLMIDKHGKNFAPGVRADYHSVAGVNLVQSGSAMGDARKHFFEALKADPHHFRHWARLAASMIAPLARRMWRPRNR